MAVACAALRAGTDVILELGLLTAAERERFYALAHDEAFELSVHVFDAPRDVRRERVLRRNDSNDPHTQRVPLKMFERASDAWKPGDAERVKSGGQFDWTRSGARTTIRRMNLKNSLIALATGLSLFATSAAAAPRELGYGIWIETYKGTYMYTVDTEAQVCLAVVAMSQGGGPTAIDCAKLKRRAEWKNIITWINDAPPPMPSPSK